MRIFRVVRGIVGTSLLWGLAWAPFGLIVVIGAWADAQFRELDRLIPPPSPAIPMIAAASWGVIAGALFAAAIAVFERGRETVERIRSSRVALFGAGVGVAIALMFPVVGLSSSLFSSLLVGAGPAAYGAAMAVGMIRLGRREPKGGVPIAEHDALVLPNA